MNKVRDTGHIAILISESHWFDKYNLSMLSDLNLRFGWQLCDLASF